MVTIKELADATGLSPSTVSVVLRGKSKERQISKATQEKILHEAARMGYRPNIAARSLRGGLGADQLQVAVFWAQDFRAGMMVRFLAGLQREMKQIQRDIRLVVFPYDNDSLFNCKALVSSSDCHAAIVCNASEKDMDFLENTELPLPIVLYNRNSARYCSVNVDDTKMGKLAARALADNGCKRVAILTNLPAFEGMNTRIKSFESEIMLDGDIEILPLIICEGSLRGGYENAKRHLALLPSERFPDGIFCGASAIGLGTLRAFWEMGIQVPQQCKIVSVGNGPEDADEFSVPGHSIVRLPMEEMAGQCLRLLLEVISGVTQVPSSRVLPIRYIARASCGALLDDRNESH